MIKKIRITGDKNHRIGYNPLEIEKKIPIMKVTAKVRRDIMRITNQMLAKTAQKSGIPLPQHTLLDIMNQESSGEDLLSSPGKTTKANSYLKKVSSKQNKQLKTSADALNCYAEKLCKEGENSLFGQAEKTGNTSGLVSHIEELADSYNKTMKYLKDSDSALNEFYLQELQSSVEEQEKALEAVGITRKKDGSLNIDKDTLKTANIDDLKAIFSGTSGFMAKVGYISGRVAENAKAMDESLFCGYGSNGAERLKSFSESMYNFWG